MSQAFESFRLDHVYRERNADADALVNEALDETSGKPGKNTSEGNPANSGSAGSPQRARARYRHGALHPLTPVELPEDAEVEILIRTIRKP
jgi:hypothetical protein